MGMIVPVLICSLIAIVAGAASGLLSPRGSSPAAEQGLHKAEAAKTHSPQSLETIRELKPIVTNLSAPPGAWIRVELAVALTGTANPKIDLQLNEFASDTNDFLRGLSAEQLEGPNGLRRLREDLLERARFRLAGNVESVLIQTLVIQ